ncbi:ArsA family ATPase [Tomitella biformata]|uniref:ArsA family ATPase n=1 Tax=Tomitella biformata TaxID=630403 RepID=UPI000A02F4B3|nr:ArsA family ATPase [Tomitella biformata]
MGKGGVGKTTVAAASAVAAARAGQRVLLVSLDQAHSLFDAFGLQSGLGVTAVAEGLDLLQLDTLTLLEDRWRPLAALLSLGGNHQHGAEFGSLEADELTGLPGVQEMLGLAEIESLVARGEWDTIFVDCAPTAETLRLLDLPEALTAYLERLWPRHRRLAQGASSPQLLLLVGLLERMNSAAAKVRELLGDGTRTRVRLVLSPERVVLAEARRTLTAMALFGISLEALIVNRVLPAAADSDTDTADDPVRAWYRARFAEQQEVLGELSADLGDTPLRTVRFAAREPVGLELLGEISVQLEIPTSPGSPPPVRGDLGEVHLESGAGLDAVYVLSVRLPLVDPATVTLGRVEDDLLLGAAGVRRRIRLASVLRRCDVAGAEMAGELLQVRFTPNPEVWPQ